MIPSRSNLYTISAGEPFLIRLAEAVLAGRLPAGDGRAPDAMALCACTILVPTRRSARALADAFLEAGEGKALLLPSIRPIGDVDEDGFPPGRADEAEGTAALDLPSAAGNLDMRLMIAREILDPVRRAGDGEAGFQATPAQALHLADELTSLIEAFDTEEVDISLIAGLVADEFAHHWAQTLGFLEVITERLPAILSGRGLLAPAARRNRLLDAAAARLKENPPGSPVIAAGSTGSIPATARLLATIAGLEHGAVVLPGLDLDLDEESWAALPSSHPQYGMASLLRAMRIGRDAVAVLPGPEAGAPSRIRFRVLNEALRPADTTEAWAAAGERIAEDQVAEAMSGFEVIAAPSPREEAVCIALILREALETPGRTAALVTPDRGLARRVAAELQRWGIAADDSAGRPLARSDAGTLMLTLIEVFTEGFSPVSLLSLLKHPLATFGLEPGEARRRTGLLELVALRGPRPGPGFSGLRGAVGAARRQVDQGHLAHGTVRRLRDRDWRAVHDLLDRLLAALSPIATLAATGSTASLGGLLRGHIEAAELACAVPVQGEGPGGPRLWLGDAGETLAGFLTEIIAAPDASISMEIADYRPFLVHLLKTAVVRPRYRTHPRISIWGLLEARLLTADVMVLGGLNESVWPPTTTVDAWLNRPMRQALGLQPPERRIGLTAHDFVQAACSPVVYLTRSQKADGAPTVPSRWLLRLRALLDGLRGDGLRDTPRHMPWLSWAQGLDGGDPDAAPVPMPRPMPPVDARPRRLSVTRIEDWIRDPYAVFAREILGLEPLDPIDADPSAAERGTAIHEILHRFALTCAGPLPEDAFERLSGIGREVFEDLSDRPGVKAFWWPRFLRASRWFVEHERALRENVRHQATEIAGELHLPAGGREFILTARADRIDVIAGNGLRICDYKTGATPSEKEVRVGLSPQLSLEAAIAAAGGFRDIGRSEVAELVYIGLSGGDPPGELRRLGDSAKLAEQAVAGLARLVADYDRPETAYLPRVAVKYEHSTYPYDHLARYLEWSLQMSDSGDGP